MQLQQANAVAATWILAAGVMGLAGNVTSLGGGAVVLGFGLLPPIVMMLLWSHRPQAVTERVRQARS